MQLVKKATVRKMIVNGRLYGRIHVAVPGWLVGKEVVVIVWTEPSIEEAYLRKKGVKLWRQDAKGNILEVVPENIRLQPKEKKQEEVKQVEKPIEEIEVKPEEVKQEVKIGEKPLEVKPGVVELLEKIRREQELKRLLEEYGKKKLGVGNV
jgi:glutamyl/glutaminyl-tRNA synthetase